MDNNQNASQTPPPQTTVSQPTTTTPPANSDQHGMSNDTKTLIVILLLIFAYGVGLIFMWLWMKTWPMWLKILLTLPVFLVIAIFALAIIVTVKSPQQIQQEMVQNEQTAKTPTPFDQDGTPTPPLASASAVQSNIEAAVTSKNYSALGSYMTENVSFVLYASECCGQITAQEAVSQLSYLDTAIAPWDFDQTNPAVVQIKTQNAQEYGDLYIGLSSDDMMAAFGLDEENKISIIKVSASYKLLVAE